MDEFSQVDREQIWFARVMMILGVKEALDVFVNLITILKVRSGLPIVSAGSDEKVALAYLISSAITGGYLLGGGSLLSRLAYGRPAPRAYLFADVALPNWTRCLAIAFRAWGGYHMIQAVGSIALGLRYAKWPEIDKPFGANKFTATEAAWSLEHLLLGFLLLALGGKIARIFVPAKEQP